MRAISPALGRSLVPYLCAAVALSACRNLDAPEPTRAAGAAVADKSRIPDTLPLRIQQNIVADPGAARVACAPGVSIPGRFVAEGVVAPHMGRTTALAETSFCLLIDDTVYFTARVSYRGVTDDSLSGVWDGSIANFHNRTGELRLTVLLLGGTGWFRSSFASAPAEGVIDLQNGSGSYLAQGRIAPRSSPVSTRAPEIIPETMSAGADYTCGVTVTGATYCWGRNAYGEVGDGTTWDRQAPTRVSGGLMFTQVSAGGGHACGLTSAGAAYCWGVNASGQLGDGTTTNRATPVAAAGGVSFVEITVGYDHTCGLTASGVVYCWGANNSGQLGDGTTTNRSVPTKTAGRLFAQISAGSFYTCGVTANGLAYCWGINQYGQLGDGTTARHLAPVSVVSGSGGLVFDQISAGGTHTCALTTDGEAYCWGQGDHGELGSGVYYGQFYVPNHVAGGYTFRLISAGDRHTCAVTSGGGAAYCWGSNASGRLGLHLMVSDVDMPRAVYNPGIVFSQISAGGQHTCAVSVLGQAYCWGEYDNGRLGGEWISDDAYFPKPVIPYLIDRGLDFTQLAGGNYHTCGVTTSGTAYCWGLNIVGELGDGTTTSHYVPSAVTGWHAFKQITAGGYHTCALSNEGYAYCWGQNIAGELGDGTTDNYPGPEAVAGGHTFARLAAGMQHTCGLTSGGQAYCWGDNSNGQLGDSTTTRRLLPTLVSGGHVFTELATGNTHTCALTATGVAYCWGNDGVLEQHAPTLVPGGILFAQIGGGERYTCGLSRAGGSVYCWGINPNGQLGNGTTDISATPTLVESALSFTQIAVGDSHVCASAAGGGTYCWGWNYYGQLGDNTLIQRLVPTAVWGSPAFSQLASGSYHSCGLADGLVSCWGRNDSGQLAYGQGAYQPKPVSIAQLLFKW